MAEKTGGEMKGGADKVAGGATGLIGEKRKNAMYAKQRQSEKGTPKA
jgi:formylmethanofuran dehydrogenase subunit C